MNACYFVWVFGTKIGNFIGNSYHEKNIMEKHKNFGHTSYRVLSFVQKCFFAMVSIFSDLEVGGGGEEKTMWEIQREYRETYPKKERNTKRERERKRKKKIKKKNKKEKQKKKKKREREKKKRQKQK